MSSESLLAGLAGGAAVAGHVGVGYWLFRDARARGSELPAVWVAAWVLFNVVGLGYYLAVRDRIGDRTVRTTRGEQAAIAVALAVALSFGAAAALGPPDPFTQVRIVAPSLLVTLPVAYAVLVGLGRFRRGSDPSK